MPLSRISTVTLAALLLLGAPRFIRGADVLELVPRDALGFVVVEGLADTNSKVETVLRALQLEFPGPLALLKSTTGIDGGLDRRGDLLLAVLPGAPPTARPQLVIWLPVTDYQSFISSLGGTTTEGITAVTISGEDLLVAPQDKWALVIDPDQRERLQQFLASRPSPPAQIGVWRNWIESNQVSVVVLQNGRQELWSWFTTDRAEDIAAIPAPSAEDTDDLFAEPGEDSVGSSDPDADYLTQLRQQVRALFQGMPELAAWAGEADSIACGWRMDENGNLVAGVRVAATSGNSTEPASLVAPTHAAIPPTLFASGEFIVSGSARMSGPFAAAAAGIYARRTAEELRDEIQVAMEDDAAGRFQKAVEEAAAGVSAASVLTRPGTRGDSVYSNAFLAVRVENPVAFIGQVGQVASVWNEMNKSEEDESRLVFETESSRIGDREATVYSLDMCEAFGTAAIPEARQSMERLFGPGGKLRLIVMPTSDNTVLLAAATPEQVAPVLEQLAQSRPTAGDERTSGLLPQDASWRVLVSPRGYARWSKRQMDAMLGPVIGAPLVRQFPASPPFVAAGGFRGKEIWIDVVVPIETIRAAGQYLHQR